MVAAFVVFAVGFLLFLLAALFYLVPSSPNGSNIPGLEPTDPVKGNLGDMAEAGSLHEFQMKLHDKFGPIASFWWGTQYMASIASSQIFKDHEKFFDRPKIVFQMFESFIGPLSVQYANGEDGKGRRHRYDGSFSHQCVVEGIPLFQEIVESQLSKWESVKEDEHVNLEEVMYKLAFTGIVRFAFGDVMSAEEVTRFQRNYDVVWDDQEESLTMGPPEQGSERQQTHDNALTEIKKVIRKIIVTRRAETSATDGRRIFLDVLLESGVNEEEEVSDVISYLVGGSHTTAYLLVWCLYYLASNPDLQKRVYEEVASAVGSDQDLTMDNLKNMPYLLQCIQETLRTSRMAPLAARIQEEDGELGEYAISKGTPVLHALGISFYDENVFPNPSKFDPERFSPELVASREKLSFEPFGFAGKRKCPGYRFAYIESKVFLSLILLQFEILLVEGQNIKTKFGLVSKPSEAVWVTLKKRAS